MSARRTNVKLVKYVLLGLVVLTLLESAYLIWYSVKNYRHIRETEVDDYFTGDHGEGYYAKGWMIAAITVLVFTDLVSLVCSWGILQDMSTFSVVYGVFMTCISTYASYDKYLRPTYVAFILPQVVGIVAILHSILNYVFKNHNPIQRDAVLELSKKPMMYEEVKVPTKAIHEYHDDADV